MAIKISPKLISKLPEEEKKDLKSKLWNKSGGICFLCAEEMFEAGEDIVPDHDTPEIENGETKISNLNLVHSTCNSFKRSHPTVDVRPYLKLTKLIKKNGGFLKYDEAAKLLGIIPTDIELTYPDDFNIEIKFSDQTKTKSCIFTETNKEGSFKFCFVEMPKSALYNDDKCQPRAIKLPHLWQIYNDINRNPLHEAPACRLERVGSGVNLYKALMFDGQHKTLSFWVDGREKIVVKIYLDISRDAAVRLINSIQSKIKKLPLSPFELSAKMAEEWQERVAKYEEEVGIEKGSEDGFLKWVETDEKARAKSAFTDALYQTFIDHEELEFNSIILKQGQKALPYTITEAVFKNKILKNLIHTSPLKEYFVESQKLRERETNSIIQVLNILFRIIFKPENGDHMSPQEEMRATRFVYQASLSYTTSLIRADIRNRLYTVEGLEFIEKDIDSEKWKIIEDDIKRLANHPVWTKPFEHSNKMRAVKDAFTKNQEGAKAFQDVGLKPGYVVGVDALDPTALDD